ncbi:hypothetical protein MJO28_002720 [Puccinia striiformis f. sp. tritici]|uniref:Uncharacterized protein n=3 Tax=Puccinia striiformis TaxID=27350 RepID=A0A0L0V2G1_9BASI|nr:hypothetical protein MJO28_002720 [Puccinia striiformis f. sp. tritici]KAI9619191.1 hypothetical protein H4Q26_011871 [Puccinia striiformis f. sp. tritici PST-130]KNE93184.1 hypothetical protein PSTG_13436 [Puccinia striiformis f. sp. tritici PST-78]POW20872.1 hypothetical protein PSHT_03042 [Puccinia striiformis]KAI7964694.1 hypothetical protein MJO29_002792 [Puccinia striiformis f. sp. tritici]
MLPLNRENHKDDARVDRVLVESKKYILALIPGRASSENNARFPFDKEAKKLNASHSIKLYKLVGIGKHSISIKVTPSWEGIQGA